MSTASQRHPSEPAAIQARGADVLAELARDLADGRPVPRAAIDELSLEELTRLVARDGLGWQALRLQPERATAVELFSLRLQVLLMEGQVKRALDELAAPPLLEDAGRTPALVHVMSAGLAGAAWRGDPRLDELLEQMTGPGKDDGLFELASAARELAPVWRRLCDEAAVPAALVRFVELFPSVSEAFRQELVANLAAALTTERQAIVRALDRMHAADPRLLAFLRRITEGLVEREDLSYEDLPERERAYIAEAMKRVEWRLVPRPAARRWWRLLWAAAVAALNWLAIGGYTGLLVGAGVLVVAFVHEALSSLGSYLEVARDRVADAVVETGLPPDRMIEWAMRRRASGDPDHPFGIDAGFAEDLALHTLGRLARISRLDSPGLASER